MYLHARTLDSFEDFKLVIMCLFVASGSRSFIRLRLPSWSKLLVDSDRRRGSGGIHHLHHQRDDAKVVRR